MLTRLIKKLFNRESEENDVGISHQYQQYDYDCGQTCLDMLGYDGHGMFPEGYLQKSELLSLPGVREREDFRLSINTYSENPCMVSVMSVTQWGDRHFALVYRDKVYCPSLGVFKVSKYSRNVWHIGGTFQVPFKREAPES